MSIARAIRSVAVIGAGPAGIVTVNELAHTAKSGISTIHSGNRPTSAAFDKIVCFEQNSKLGGVWNYFKTPDPKLPGKLNGNFSDPDFIYEKAVFPSKSILQSASFKTPFVREGSKTGSQEVRWQRNAAYEDLFTNIPEKFMRFSYQGYQNLKNNKIIGPLVTSKDVTKYLNNIVDKYDLKRYLRLNSSVEAVEKVENEKGVSVWRLTVRQKSPLSRTEHWYQEDFDAVVAANGHCSVPFIPNITNLESFVAKHPDVIRHSKSYRESDDYKDGKVLLVGSGTSAADLAQYIVPKAKSVTISQRSQSVYDWIKECFDQTPEVAFKPRIKQLLPDTKQVEFEDGSVESYDHIILGTGYHYHWPFLNKSDEIVKIYKDEASNSPVNKIGNLYMYAFSTKDNTFATVGIPTVNLMFHNMEYGAVAIAGVFSGAKKLPSVQTQLEWDASRTQIAEPEVPHRYQGFFLEKLNEQLFDPLYKLAPLERQNPLDKNTWSAEDFEASNLALQNIYLKLKNKEVKEQEICN